MSKQAVASPNPPQTKTELINLISYDMIIPPIIKVGMVSREEKGRKETVFN